MHARYAFERFVFRCGCTARAGVEHVVVPAAQSCATPEVIVGHPGDSMHSVRNAGSVEAEESHRTAAVCVTRKEIRDVAAEVVVSRLPYGNAVQLHRQRVAILRNESRIGSDRPTEVYIRIAAGRAALARCVDGSEWFSCMRIVDGNGARA